MTNTYYSVGINNSEALLGSMDLYRIMHETNAKLTVLGSDEDPKLYVLYRNTEDRDAGFEALRDRFRSAVNVYSPFNIGEEESNDGDDDNGQ